jgi:predicted kinase
MAVDPVRVGQLIVFAGLPGVGKTTLARQVADALDVTFLRIDTIEVAVLRSGLPIAGNPVGYLVASWVAADQLHSGRSVVTDAVNNVEIARLGWREIAADTGASVHFVEVVCSDAVEHRRRVEARTADIEGLANPSWADIQARRWESLDEPHLRIDNLGPSAPHVQAVLDWLSR